MMVNIIIVNYNCWELTKACVESLIKSTYKEFKIFIVDNHSRDDSVEKLMIWIEKQSFSYTVIKAEDLTSKTQNKFVNIVRNSSNSGFGSANNIIIEHLLKTNNDEFIWLLNPDTEVEKNVMIDLLKISQDKEKLIVGNIIYYFDNREKIMYYGGFNVKKWIHGVRNVKSKKDKHNIDAVAGTSLFSHISTFKELGLLPGQYFMYWEETDFCTKAKRIGYKFDVNDKSKIFDHVGASSNGNFLREYLYILNGLRYYMKYYPRRTPIIFFTSIAKMIKAIIFDNQQKKKALFYGNLDFIRSLLGIKINVIDRINTNQ